MADQEIDLASNPENFLVPALLATLAGQPMDERTRRLFNEARTNPSIAAPTICAAPSSKNWPRLFWATIYLLGRSDRDYEKSRQFWRFDFARPWTGEILSRIYLQWIVPPALAVFHEAQQARDTELADPGRDWLRAVFAALSAATWVQGTRVRLTACGERSYARVRANGQLGEPNFLYHRQARDLNGLMAEFLDIRGADRPFPDKDIHKILTGIRRRHPKASLYGFIDDMERGRLRRLAAANATNDDERVVREMVAPLRAPQRQPIEILRWPDGLATVLWTTPTIGNFGTQRLSAVAIRRNAQDVAGLAPTDGSRGGAPATTTTSDGRRLVARIDCGRERCPLSQFALGTPVRQGGDIVAVTLDLPAAPADACFRLSIPQENTCRP